MPIGMDMGIDFENPISIGMGMILKISMGVIIAVPAPRSSLDCTIQD